MFKNNNNYGIDYDTQSITNKKITYKGINQLHPSLTPDNYLTCAIMAQKKDITEDEKKEHILNGTKYILEENSFIELKYKQIIYDEHKTNNTTTEFKQSGCDKE